MRSISAKLLSPLAGVLLVGSLGSPGISSAADYIYRFDTTFSGTSPSSSGPWLDALFHDVASGTVSLTISNNGLTGTEYVSGLYFNLNPNLDPTSLSFQFTGGDAGSVPLNIFTGVNQFKADGDGKYDILFDFNTANGFRFEAGDYLVYTISGIPSLNGLDFNFLSAPAGGAGPFLAAAHIQSIGQGDSGWVRPTDFVPFTPVPEPSALALFALSFAFLIKRRFNSGCRN